MQLVISAASTPSLFSPAWRNVSIGAVGLCSMMAFEAIGVAAAMPAVATALDGMTLYALAFASTLAGSVVAMVWSGVDCDRHGPFRSMAGGLLLFAIGLLIAGLADSMPSLIVGRGLQGLGVGALGVALYVATARAVPEVLHPRLFALFSSAWVVPAVVGPAIAGWIVEQLGWRWLFLGVLLLLLPTAALILPPLRRSADPEAPPSKRNRLLPWALLAAVSCVVLSVSASAQAWAPLVVALTLTAIAASAMRLLPAGTIQLSPGLPTVIALRGLNSAAFFLCEAFIPLWLVQQRGWSIAAAGLALTSGALAWSLGSHLQSRVSDEVRRGIWLRRGCLLLSIGIAICAVVACGLLPDWLILIGWACSGLGVGLSLPMLGVLTLKLAPRALQGTYSSALQLCAALCISTALAAGGLLFALLRAQHATLAFLSVFALAALLSILAWASVPRALAFAAPALPDGARG